MPRDTTLPAPPQGSSKPAPAPPEPVPFSPPTTQIVKVYHCNVLLKSKVALGYRVGDLMNIVATTPTAAVATIQALFGSDVQFIGSPTLALDGCWTTMTGT
jgi:hypothetical protein